MAQLKNVVDPFGEVNVHPAAPGRNRVVATILMAPYKEGAQTGIALDGSGSMSKLYGVSDGSGALSPIFGGPKKATNEVSPVAQKICSYLARKMDADGGTTVIYWAVDTGGSKVEVVGDFTAEEAERHVFGPPAEFGTGTQLLPAVRYFTDRFRTAPYGFYVFITDGELHDLDEVKEYSVQLAREIASGRRNPVKFVLIGLGEHVNEVQMHELDDLDAGVDVDLWDHKLASEMRVLEQIFAEVVDRNARVANNGRILDPQGRVVRDYGASGLPAYIEFEIDSAADHFVLEVNGHRVTQPLREGGAAQAQSQTFATRQEEPYTAEVVEEATYVEPKKQEEYDESAAEWKDLPLEFEKNHPAGGGPDLHLEKQPSAGEDPGVDLEKHEN